MKRMTYAFALGMAMGAGILTAASYAQETSPRDPAVQKPMGDVSGVSGWIEDGTAHKPGTSSADVKSSVAKGAPLVFVDDKARRVWTIDNPQMVKGHEGHHVIFSGGIDSVAKTIHVTSLTMAKSQKPGAEAEAVGH
jgi:hypothetical protein